MKRALLEQLGAIDGLTARPSKVAGGTALFFRGREFAHFHHDAEIDLRLTRSVIKALGLSHPPRPGGRPARAASSEWIEVRFQTMDDVRSVAELVRHALRLLDSPQAEPRASQRGRHKRGEPA